MTGFRISTSTDVRCRHTFWQMTVIRLNGEVGDRTAGIDRIPEKTDGPPSEPGVDSIGVLCHCVTHQRRQLTAVRLRVHELPSVRSLSV